MKLSVSLRILNLGQSVGLLGRVISSSQDLYLHITSQTYNKRTHAYKRLKYESNLRSRHESELRPFMPQTIRLPWPVGLRAVLSQWSGLYCSRVSRFECRTRHWLSDKWLSWFSSFPPAPRSDTSTTPQLFSLKLMQFIIHSSAYLSMQYSQRQPQHHKVSHEVPIPGFQRRDDNCWSPHCV
jgi:hypothetical protein